MQFTYLPSSLILVNKRWYLRNVFHFAVDSKSENYNTPEERPGISEEATIARQSATFSETSRASQRIMAEKSKQIFFNWMTKFCVHFAKMKRSPVKVEWKLTRFETFGRICIYIGCKILHKEIYYVFLLCNLLYKTVSRVQGADFTISSV